MPYNVDTQNAIDDVKALLSKHTTKWKDHTGNRSVLYVPFTQDELRRVQADGNEPDLAEQAQGTADGLMLRAFAKGVQQHDQNKEVELTASTLMSKWKNHLTAAQKEAVLDEVVRKTPAILMSGQALTHGGQVISDGPVFLRPTDSLNVTGHGSPESKVICMTPSLKSGKPLTAAQTVERMQNDLANGVLAVALYDENAAPKVKLNSCGSSGEFHMAFAEAAKEEGLPVEVYAYGMDQVQNRTPASTMSHLDTGSRFVATNADMDAVDILNTAAMAAGSRAKVEGEEVTLAQLSENGNLSTQVQELRSQQEALQLDVATAESMVSIMKADQWDAESIRGSKESRAVARAALEQNEKKLAQLEPLLALDKLLEARAQELGLPADGLRQLPLKDLGAALKQEALKLDAATKHKASEHRSHISVREALNSGGPLKVNPPSHGQAVGHVGTGSF